MPASQNLPKARWMTKPAIPFELFCAFLWLTFRFPADAVFRVFEDDAAAGEFVADLVRTTKVAAAARFLAFVNQRLNLTIEHLALLLAKNIQHGVEAIDSREQLALVSACTCLRASAVFTSRERL